MTDPVRKFFKEGFTKGDQADSLRRIEFLIVDTVRPYKIVSVVFLLATLALGGYLYYQADNFEKMSEKMKEQQAAVNTENAKLRELLDSAEKRADLLARQPLPVINPGPPELEGLASTDPPAFFERLITKVKAKELTKKEIARLIKVAAAKDAPYTMRQVRSKRILTAMLSKSELAEIGRLSSVK